MVPESYSLSSLFRFSSNKMIVVLIKYQIFISPNRKGGDSSWNFSRKCLRSDEKLSEERKKMFFQCKTQGIGFSRTTNKTLFLLSTEHKKENKNFIHCVGNHLFARGAGKIVLSAQKSSREEILVIFLFVSFLKPSWESFPRELVCFTCGSG